MDRELKRLPAYFYRSDSGREPVREWLKGLMPADRKIIGEDIKDVEYSWPLGMPLVRSLGHGLWEVRSHLSGNRIARVIFCVDEGRIVLLHGFIKKESENLESGYGVGTKAQAGRTPMRKKNIGTSFDSWLDEEGIRQEVTAGAIKRVLARQVATAMAQERLTKTEMARRMQTSRSALNRLLDAGNESVTLATLQKAATAMGREVRLELV